MGRRTDTDVNIRNYTSDTANRYLIGHCKAKDLKIKDDTDEVVFGLDLLRNEAYLASSKRARADQELIDEVRGIETTLKCPERTLKGIPVLLYGYTDPDIVMSDKFEQRIRSLRRNNKLLTNREINREVYGDEIFCLVGKFEFPDGDWLAAVGKVYLKAGGTRNIFQKIHRLPEEKFVLKVTGESGICFPTTVRRVNTLYTWHLDKQFIGSPRVHFDFRRGDASKNKAFQLDITGPTPKFIEV